jgi:hypothetical protein
MTGEFDCSLSDERIVVLKAFDSGSTARANGTAVTADSLCKRTLAALSTQSPTTRVLQLRMLFMLLLAEMNRPQGAVPYCEAASHVADLLEDEGEPSCHLKLYMDLLNAVSPTTTTGNFGDLTEFGLQTESRTVTKRNFRGFSYQEDIVLPNLGLSSGDALVHDRFLAASLQEIVSSI